MSYQCISIEEAQSLIEEGDVVIFDIRDPGSFERGHIQNAIHVSNETMDAVLATIFDGGKAIH